MKYLFFIVFVLSFILLQFTEFNVKAPMLRESPVSSNNEVTVCHTSIAVHKGYPFAISGYDSCGKSNSIEWRVVVINSFIGIGLVGFMLSAIQKRQARYVLFCAGAYFLIIVIIQTVVRAL